jgi:hypothetical protein
MSIKPQVLDLIALVERGQMLDAISKHYAEHVAMRENVSPPTVGLAANLAREAAFFGSLRSYTFTLVSVAIDGNTAILNWVFDYTTSDGTPYRMDEIAIQAWENGKIVHERFVYDTGSLAVAA